MTAVGRAGAGALLLLLALATPGVAQRRDRAEAEAFLLFLESVAAQRTARVCERGIPGTASGSTTSSSAGRRSIGVAWSGASASSTEAAAEKDRPDLDHAKMDQIARAIAELGAAAGPDPDRGHRRHADGVRAGPRDLEGALAR